MQITLGCAGLKDVARTGVEDVLHVYWRDEGLERVFTSTPEGDCGLRRVLVRVLQEHPGVWLDGGGIEEWVERFIKRDGEGDEWVRDGVVLGFVEMGIGCYVFFMDV